MGGFALGTGTQMSGGHKAPVLEQLCHQLSKHLPSTYCVPARCKAPGHRDEDIGGSLLQDRFVISLPLSHLLSKHLVSTYCMSRPRPELKQRKRVVPPSGHLLWWEGLEDQIGEWGVGLMVDSSVSVRSGPCPPLQEPHPSAWLVPSSMLQKYRTVCRLHPHTCPAAFCAFATS